MNQGISARIMHKLLSLFVILTTLFNPVLAVVATAAPAASPESQDSPILPNASVLRDAPAFQGRPQIQTDKPAFRGRPQIQTDKPAFRGRPQPIPEALPPDEDFVEIPQYSPEQAWDELDLESPLPTNAAGLDPDATLDEQPAWLQALYSQAVGRDNEEFHVVADSAGGLQAKNTAHGLNSSFGDGGFRVQSGNDFFQLRLRQYGYGATLFPVQTATPQVDGNRVEYLRGDLTEWYLNGPLGLEQGFTLDAPPPTAEGPLTLLLDLSSSLQAQVQADKRGLSLNRAGGSAALTYSGLTAYDADGQELDTWLELATSATAETQLLLRVDDTGAVYPLTIDPWVQIARFMGRGTQSEYFAQSFGEAVAVSADSSTIVVGAYRSGQVSSSFISHTGAVYVFAQPPGGWSNTPLIEGETAKLSALDGEDDDEFGGEVAVSADGSVIVVGAESADSGSSGSGSAYVFERPGGGWSTTATTPTLLPSEASYGFGRMVDVSADGATIIVGGGAYGGPRIIHVFERPGGDWSTPISQTANIVGPLDSNEGADFGSNVAIDADGSTIIVGAARTSNDGIDFTGAVHVFERPVSGWMITPTLTAKLTASDKANQDLLGEGVDISGDGTVIVAGSNVDSIYVFERPGGNWITGTEVVSFDVVYCDETQFNHERNHVVIASDGNTIVVGDQCANSDEGMLYAFERVGGWITATQVATLTSSHPNLTRLLGDAVAINADGSLIFTGGQGAHEYAHVFERSGGAWASSTQTGMLLPSDWRYTDSYFGESIAKSADDRTIVVGAPNDVNELTWVQGGSAYVFEQQGAGWSSAVSVTQLFSSDGADDDNFGKAVDVSADGATIVVGAYADDNDYGGDFAGSAYVFERPGGGWTTAQPQTAKLTASNAGGNDWFGGTIGIDADASTIVVGAYGQDSYDGSALVFERPGGGWITATQTAKLTASDGAAGGDNFGYAVDISADDSTIVVGSVYDDDNGSSSGSAYVFEQPGGGWITATQTTKLLPSDGAADDRFGSFVAINADGAAIVVGVYRDDDNGTESGSAYVFERAGGGWSTPTVAQTTKLLASDGVADDRFGSFVAINADGTAIVVGAPYDDDNAAESGSVYLFDRPGGGWLATTTELAKHVPPDIDSYDYFGSSGAIGGDTILVVATQMHTTIGTVFVLGHNTSYAPIFSSSPVTTAIEDSAYVYDITTDDADSGDVLTITALISPTWLSLVDHGDRTATLSGTPLNAHVGTHNVTLQVSDGISSITQVFVITVTNTNDAPTFSSSPGITATIDQPYNYDITIQDDDGDSVTITDLTKPAWLTLIDDGDGTGSLSGTPSDDDAFPPCGDNGKISSRNTLYGYSPSASGTRCGRYPTSDIGSHSVILEVTDGLSTTAQAFSIQVTGSELSFSSSPVTAAVQDQPYAYDVSASTPGGGVLTFTATLKPAWLTFVDNGDSTARLSGTPTGGELGTHSVNLQVTDGTVTADQAFTITVGTEYPFLLFTTSAATGATQEQDYTYTVTVAGPSGSEPWQINAPLLPAWLGLYDRGDGTAILSGIPRNAHVGSHRVALMARDGLDDTAIQIFDIGVQNVNDAPTFLSSAIKEADEDALYQYTVVAEDIDVGETPILAAQSKPAWLSFVDNGDGTGLLSGTPANADVGDHTVHLTARDPVSATATQIFILTVRNVNDAPVFTSTTPITSIDENTPYAYEIGASDDDVDDVLSFTGITLPSWLAVYDRGDGTAVLHGDPTKDDLGDHAVTLQVQDAALAATTQSFTVTVNNVNDPPEFSSRPSKVAFLYQAYAYDITASDVDIADVLTIEATQKPTWLSFGTLQRAAGTTDTASLNGTPGVAELGVHNISLLVSDAAGLTTTQPYTLTVVNRVPITHVDFVEVYTNQVSIAISVLDNDFDPDGELLSLVSFSQPLTGTTALSGSDQIVYTLFPGFTGDDPFTYQVSDGLDQVTGHVKVRVVPYHNAPILKPDTATAYENMPIRIPILDNDRDPEGTALQIVEIEKLSGPDLSAIIAGDGSDFTFTGFGAGTAVLRYTAQDAGYDIASPRLASTLVTVTVHAYDPGATVASAISGLSNVSMDSGETVELGGRIVLQNTSNNAGRFSFEYALESGSVTPIVLNMGAIPEQGSCQVDFGNNSIACDLGAIAGQSEAAVVISATVQAHGLGNFRQAATMKSSNPGGYHSTSPYVYVVSGGRETRNIRPDLTITADAYEEPQPDGSIKAIGKIQLGEHFIVESYGSFYSPYLTYATDGSFEGEGQVRYVGGRPGYKLGRFIRGAFSAAASADEFVPQAGATLYLWGWFNFYNIQLDGLNLSTGLVRGNADVSFWKRGSDVDPPLSMDIEQMPDGLQSATVHAPSAVKYGSGGLTLKDINLEMMFKEVYYLAGTATLHLRVDPRIDPIPLELTLGSDGTLRGKYTAEESLKFDFSGEGKIVVIKPTLDNTHFFGAGGTIHLPTGKVVDATFDSSWNYNPFPPAFGGGGDVAQYNEQEQKLRINLPQNTNVVFDNFVAGSDAANPPLSIKVADFELTLESPKLLYGELLQADSASLVLPSSLGGEMLVLEGPVKIFPDYIEFGGVSAPTDLDLFDNWVHMSLNQVKIIREGSAFILQLFGDLEKLGVADANAETSLRIDVRGRTKFGGGLTGLSFAFMGMEATGDNVDISSDGLRADELGFQLPMKPFGGTGSYGASIYNFGVTRNGFEIGGGKFRLPNVKIGGFRLATLMGELKPAAEQGVYDISVEGGFNIDGSGGKSCLLGGGFTLRWDRTQSKHVMYADASNADGAELHVTALDGSQDVIPLTPEVMAQPIIVGGERVPSATPRSLDAVQGLSVRKVTIWLRDCEFKLDPTIPFVLTRAEGSLILEDDTKKVVLQVGLAVGKEVEIGSFSLGYPLSADLSLTVATPYRGCSAGASFNGEVTMFDTIKVGEANANIDCNGFEADVSLVPRGPLQEAHGEIAIWGPDNDPNMAGRLSVKVGVNPREFFDYWPVPDQVYDFEIGAEMGKFNYGSGDTAWGFKGWVVLPIIDTLAFYIDTDFNLAVGGDVKKYQLVTRNRALRAWEQMLRQQRLSADQGDNPLLMPSDTDLTFVLPAPGTSDMMRGIENGPLYAPRAPQDMLVNVDVPYATEMFISLASETPNLTMTLIAPDSTLYGHDSLPAGITYGESTEYYLGRTLSPAASLGQGQLRVVHAVSDGAAMDVLVDDVLTFSGLTFTDTAAYQSFAPGSYTVKFVAAGTTSPVLAETFVNLGV
ncbi:MAG: tandem-95 repeat protein, partial [Chloroflexi bacterium]|nr:tandem-95 repeat protein [Chloroflexota bacterium]